MEVKQKIQKPAPSFMGLKILATLTLIILVGITVTIQKTRGSYHQKIKGKQKIYFSLSKNKTAINNIKNKRAEFFGKVFLIDSPIKYSYFSADFVRKLSLITPREVQLTEAEIKPANQNIRFILKGKSPSNKQNDPPSGFLMFYKKLGHFEGFIRLEYSKVLTKPHQIDESEEFLFVINGEIELE